MIEVLEFYTSSFGRWAGITIGMMVVFGALGSVLASFVAILRRRG